MSEIDELREQLSELLGMVRAIRSSAHAYTDGNCITVPISKELWDAMGKCLEAGR